MGRGAQATIDLGALQHNLRQLQQLTPTATAAMAVIKADAYGHGSLAVAGALGAADAFAVATLDEAVELRENGVTKPILLLEGVMTDADLQAAAGYGLWLVVHELEQVRLLEMMRGQRAQRLQVWLKANTGMNRLGLKPDQAEIAWSRLEQVEAIGRLTLMSHMACADEPRAPLNEVQLDAFSHLYRRLQRPAASLCNSAATLNFPTAHYDWIRPGIGLYGAQPSATAASMLDLRPVMTLSSQLLTCHNVAAGEYVGYGADYKAEQALRCGVVAIGYGDGYPRHVQGANAYVLIRGVACAVIGRVSMDMIVVDLNACPGAQRGDRVVLWGQGLPVDKVAGWAGTLSYELLCQVTQRIPRIYGESSGIESAPTAESEV